MTAEQKERLIRLHQRAEQHANEYRRLSRDAGTQSMALRHLRKAERLCGYVRDLISGCAAGEASEPRASEPCLSHGVRIGGAVMDSGS